MKGELLRTSTSDGIELQAFLASPQNATDTAVLHVHGLAGNFYENRFIDHLCRALVDRDAHFLSTNNRGHDYFTDFVCEDQSTGETAFRQIGAAYELIEDSILDIRAWVDFLRSRGCTKIILHGHSCGAIKVAHYLSRADDSDVVGLVLLSPWDSVGTMTQELGEKLSEGLEIASKMIAEGNGMELMPKEYFIYPVSARSYLNFFQEASPLGVFNLYGSGEGDSKRLDAIRVPVLTVVGTVEEAFVGEPERFLSSLRVRLMNAQSFTGKVIKGAPHSYLGYEKEVSEAVGDWVGKLRGQG